MKKTFFISLFGLLLALPASAAYVGELSSVAQGSYNDQWRVIGSTSSLLLDDVSGTSDLTQTEIVNVSSDAGGTFCEIRLGNPGTTETVYLGDVHQIGSWYAGVVDINTTTWRCLWAYNFDDTNFSGSSPGGGEVIEDDPGDLLQDSCSETDGGHEIYLKGTNSGIYNGNSYAADDYCMQTPDDLFEYACNGNQNGGQVVTCEHGCVDGACVEPPEEEEVPENSCSETDGGVDEFERGTNDGYYNGNAYSVEDYCLNTPDQLLEYYCDTNQNMDRVIDCVWGCLEGECLEQEQEESQGDSCTDSDGTDSSVFGQVSGYDSGEMYEFSDECSDEGDVIEKYCQHNSPAGIHMPCEHGCDNGVCLSSPAEDATEEPPENSCSDSDGGSNRYEFGQVSGYDSGEAYELSDECTDEGDVLEMYCRNTGAPAGIHSTCQHGCQDGACLLSWETRIRSPFLRAVLRWFYFAPSGIFSFTN